jgi:DNA-directed RNA polymerase beta subunit
VNKETGEIKTQEVFFGDFPIMTEMGTFIINGGERIIVSQLVRSPGVYFNDKVDKNGKVGYGSTVIPNRGAWLELETDSKDIAYTRIDRTRKIPFTTLVRALGFSGDDEILISLVIANWFVTPLKKIFTKTQQILVLMKRLKKFMSAFVQVNQKLLTALVVLLDSSFL